MSKTFDLVKELEDVPLVPVSCYYLSKVDKTIPPDKYKPVSYEYWLMLKELEPSKFGDDYKFYLRLKQEQYDREVESKKNCSAELKCFVVILDSRKYETIENAKKQIKETESDPFFDKWVNEIVVKDILNL
jgi:hypothetical protein